MTGTDRHSFSYIELPNVNGRVITGTITDYRINRPTIYRGPVRRALRKVVG